MSSREAFQVLSDFLNGPEGSKMSELGDLSCWVCGKEKARKCAACLASGFEIFFCSPEHQRLVWPLHRHVCGSRSRPFFLPDLTDVEISRLVQLQDETIHLPDKSIPIGTIDDELGVAPYWLVSRPVKEHLEMAAALQPGTFMSVFLPLARQGFPIDPLNRRNVILACHYVFVALDKKNQVKHTFDDWTWPMHLADWVFLLANMVHDFPETVSDDFLHRATVLTALVSRYSHHSDAKYHDWIEHVMGGLILSAAQGLAFPAQMDSLDFARLVSWKRDEDHVMTFVGCEVQPCTHEFPDHIWPPMMDTLCTIEGSQAAASTLSLAG
ncbi:hypothetical protein OF846_002019 [Rhodotorula toruloides]|nr:hypothetical protein OF846_002019 [Rhodotorula toruloides]